MITSDDLKSGINSNSNKTTDNDKQNNENPTSTSTLVSILPDNANGVSIENAVNRLQLLPFDLWRKLAIYDVTVYSELNNSTSKTLSEAKAGETSHSLVPPPAPSQ